MKDVIEGIETVIRVLDSPRDLDRNVREIAIQALQDALSDVRSIAAPEVQCECQYVFNPSHIETNLVSYSGDQERHVECPRCASVLLVREQVARGYEVVDRKKLR